MTNMTYSGPQPQPLHKLCYTLYMLKLAMTFYFYLSTLLWPRLDEIGCQLGDSWIDMLTCMRKFDTLYYFNPL